MLNKCEHIGIMVSDVERSIRFYRDVLGLPFIERRAFKGLDLAFLQIGDTQLELVAGTADHQQADGLVNHVAFTVSDLDAVVAHLRAEGVELISEAPQPIWEGMRVFFFRGPDGEKLELFERS